MNTENAIKRFNALPIHEQDYMLSQLERLATFPRGCIWARTRGLVSFPEGMSAEIRDLSKFCDKLLKVIEEPKEDD